MATAISEWAGKLGDDEPAVACKAYRQIEQEAVKAGAKGRQAMDEVADALAAELTAMTPERKNDEGKTIPPEPVHSAKARNAICRLLAYVGGSKQVPALAGQIKDLDTREMARWSLDRNTSDEATDALIAALGEIGPVFRTGVVNALGARQSGKATEALRKTALEDAITEVRINAIEALANIPDGENAVVVMRAAMSAEPAHTTRTYKAAIRLADRFARAGKTKEATGIYRMVSTSEDAPEAQKKAAEKMLGNWQ